MKAMDHQVTFTTVLGFCFANHSPWTSSSGHRQCKIECPLDSYWIRICILTTSWVFPMHIKVWETVSQCLWKMWSITSGVLLDKNLEMNKKKNSFQNENTYIFTYIYIYERHKQEWKEKESSKIRAEFFFHSHSIKNSRDEIRIETGIVA